MFYYLHELSSIEGLGFLNVFRYLTFRSAYAAVMALFLSLSSGRTSSAGCAR